MMPLMYRVRDRVDEHDDTVTLTLEPRDEAESIAMIEPGQFTMLWAFGIGEAPISIARIEPDRALVHTIREVGAVTQALCKLHPGDEVGVRGPFGSCWPIDQAVGDDVLVIAGGLGLSPVRPIVDQLVASPEDFGRCQLLVGARTPDGLLYPDELEGLRAEGPVSVEVIVDAADDTWTGHVGLITKLVARVKLDPERTQAFVCGPEPMMRFVAMELVARELSPDRIWLSLERNMHCAIAQCGHCQLGSLFLCREGPVVTWRQVEALLGVAER